MDLGTISRLAGAAQNALGFNAKNVAKTQGSNLYNAASDPNIDLIHGIGLPNNGTATNSKVVDNGYNYKQQAPLTTVTDNSLAAQQAAARAQYGDPSQYDQAINGYNKQLGGLGDYEQVGNYNVDQQYQKALQGVYDQQGIDERNYTNTKNQNTQAYTSNRTKTLNATRNNSLALQRLLGMNGAGNSSAALEQAPYAAGLQGTQDLQAAQQTYGTNMSNLDNNWSDAQKKYRDAFSDLDTQKAQGKNKVKSDVLGQRANLLQQIADATSKKNLASGRGAGANPYEGEIQSLLSQITQLGRTGGAPITAQKVAPANFTLADYAGGPQAAIQPGGNPAQQDIASIFQPLLGQKKDEYGQTLYS